MIPEPQPIIDETDEFYQEVITEPARKVCWTVAELLDAEFPEPRWAIPGIIPEGLTILGGRPKVGKSFLMLQAAWAIGSGGRFFDQPIEAGRVLYLALEDSPRRLQKRICDMGIDRGAMIDFYTNWQPFQKGGLDNLLIEVESGIYRFIVIDTLTRAIPGVDQKDETEIGPIFDSLQRIAMTRGIAISLIDHTRKPIGLMSDPIDDIMNSTAKTAIADVILALYKERGKAGAILRGRGRDIEDVDLRLEWDVKTRCWQSMGDAGELAMTERRQEIMDALAEIGRAQVKDIADLIRQPKSNTHCRLQDLYNAGLINRFSEDGKVCYELK